MKVETVKKRLVKCLYESLQNPNKNTEPMVELLKRHIRGTGGQSLKAEIEKMETWIASMDIRVLVNLLTEYRNDVSQYMPKYQSASADYNEKGEWVIFFNK